MSAEVAKALPPSILALFSPRPPVEFFKPATKGRPRPYDGVGALLEHFESKEESDAAAASWTPYETLAERRARAKVARAARFEAHHEAMASAYDPSQDERACGDPFRTLFVSRLVRSRTAAHRTAARARGRLQPHRPALTHARPAPCPALPLRDCPAAAALDGLCRPAVALQGARPRPARSRRGRRAARPA